MDYNNLMLYIPRELERTISRAVRKRREELLKELENNSIPEGFIYVDELLKELHDLDFLIDYCDREKDLIQESNAAMNYIEWYKQMTIGDKNLDL